MDFARTYYRPKQSSWLNLPIIHWLNLPITDCFLSKTKASEQISMFKIKLCAKRFINQNHKVPGLIPADALGLKVQH